MTLSSINSESYEESAYRKTRDVLRTLAKIHMSHQEHGQDQGVSIVEKKRCLEYLEKEDIWVNVLNATNCPLDTLLELAASADHVSSCRRLYHVLKNQQTSSSRHRPLHLLEQCMTRASYVQSKNVAWWAWEESLTVKQQKFLSDDLSNASHMAQEWSGLAHTFTDSGWYEWAPRAMQPTNMTEGSGLVVHMPSLWFTHLLGESSSWKEILSVLTKWHQEGVDLNQNLSATAARHMALVKTRERATLEDIQTLLDLGVNPLTPFLGCPSKTVLDVLRESEDPHRQHMYQLFDAMITNKYLKDSVPSKPSPPTRKM